MCVSLRSSLAALTFLFSLGFVDQVNSEVIDVDVDREVTRIITKVYKPIDIGDVEIETGDDDVIINEGDEEPDDQNDLGGDGEDETLSSYGLLASSLESLAVKLEGPAGLAKLNQLGYNIQADEVAPAAEALRALRAELDCVETLRFSVDEGAIAKCADRDTTTFLQAVAQIKNTSGLHLLLTEGSNAISTDLSENRQVTAVGSNFRDFMDTIGVSESTASKPAARLLRK